MEVSHEPRIEELLRKRNFSVRKRTDQKFAYLMGGQWVAGIVAAVFLTPSAGSGWATHLNLALFGGGVLALIPAALAFFYPGKTFTRHTIAACQVLFSSVFIHISGGRIETHFHIIGSLAFLCFYRDWKVIATATIVTLADHVVAGQLWPAQWFGVDTISPWRLVEHAGWILFIDFFLMRGCVRLQAHMRHVAHQQAMAEASESQVNALLDELKREESLSEGSHRQLSQMLDLTREQQHYLQHRVDYMIKEMRRFAAGDLTIELQTDREDEIGRLFNNFNSALGNIRHLMKEASHMTAKTSHSAALISSTSERLAAGTTEQSQRATELTTAVEEMSATIINNSATAGETSRITQKCGEVAEKGGAVVQKTIEKIQQIAEVVNGSAEVVGRLGEASVQINEIVSVIDDIAKQTNLLALNASIEAARAGEQGKGFAVVADEVRKLAERTTEATQRIGKTLETVQQETQQVVASMETGTKRVDEGLGLADEAGKALQEVVTNVQFAVERVAEYAAATEEQTSVAMAIARSVEMIAQISQQSASGTTEIANASAELNNLTIELNGLVSMLKLGGDPLPAELEFHIG